MTEAEHQRLSLFDALLDGPVTEDHAQLIGIRRLSRRICELRHMEGVDIETMRGPMGVPTEYRLRNAQPFAR
jgi:hypothetical protein